MRTWRLNHERKSNASIVDPRRQAADRLGWHGTEYRGLRPLPSRGDQPSPILPVEKATHELRRPRLRGQARAAQRSATASRSRKIAIQNRHRRNHRRKSRPKKGALGLEDHGQLPPKLQKRVHDEVTQTKLRSAWPATKTLQALGISPRSYYRWLKEKSWTAEDEFWMITRRKRWDTWFDLKTRSLVIVSK